MDDRQLRKIFASTLVLSLIVFLIYAMIPYITAVFGAIILYTLFRPIQKEIMQKTSLAEQGSAIAVIIISLLIVTIPLILVLNAAYSELSGISIDYEPALESLESFDELIPQVDLTGLAQREFSKIGDVASDMLFETVHGLGNLMLNLVLMYFFLYYLFTTKRQVKLKICDFSPFNSKNTGKLIKEFKNITNTTILVTGVIAVLQGTLLGLGFWIFGIPGAVLWGLVAAILSFLPIVGPPIIWLPAVIILFINGQTNYAIGLLIWGLFLSNIDNLIRPQLQKRVGNIHPLISILGVFIGIPLFGLVGVVIGPLMLSYLLLMVKMYQEEYID